MPAITVCIVLIRNVYGETMDDFICLVKITAVKKLVWNEVIFVDDMVELDALSAKITELFFKRGIIEKYESIRLSQRNRNINLIGNHQDTAEEIFTALEDFSKESGLGFIVNFICQEDFMANGLFISLGDVHFHPELILDGRRLINDFPDANLNRVYLDIYHDLMVDCSTKDKTLVNEVLSHEEGIDYWRQFSDEELVQKGFVYHDQAEKVICTNMLDSLNRYFQVDFTSDAKSGLINQTGEGLNEDVRKKIFERY